MTRSQFSKRFFIGTLTSSVIGISLLSLTTMHHATGIEPQQSGRSAKAPSEDSWADAPKYVPKTREQLRKSLTEIQFKVTQDAGTETAFTNPYWANKKPGTYTCVVCGLSLFDSAAKYKSGTGWPSFWKPISKNNVGTQTDWKAFYPRTEVHCKRCKAHLGHVFKDGPEPTGLRYCMNSAGMKFVEKKPASGASAKANQ